VNDGGDELWAKIRVQALPLGDVVCRCPACVCRQLARYRPASQRWPHCRVCMKAPHIEPLDDPQLARAARARARKARRTGVLS